jgi:NTP pyrophosphatase (non-canonical NTP hydrolase)
VGKLELIGLLNNLRRTLNSEAYCRMKAVCALIFMPNHHFGPEDKKKIDRMIVGEIGGTIEASFNDLLIVKTPGDKGTTFYLTFITRRGPKIDRVDLTVKKEDNNDDNSTGTKSDGSTGSSHSHESDEDAEDKDTEDEETEDELGDHLTDLKITAKDDDSDSDFEDAYNIGLTQELIF